MLKYRTRRSREVCMQEQIPCRIQPTPCAVVMAYIAHPNGARFRDRSPVEPALNHPEVAGCCNYAQCYHVVDLSSSIITYCTLSLSLLLGSASCVRLRTPVYICSAYIHDASCEMTQYGSCVANSCLVCHLNTLVSGDPHHFGDFLQHYAQRCQHCYCDNRLTLGPAALQCLSSKSLTPVSSCYF